MLNKLNNPLTALLSLLAFAWLAWYSYHHETSYTASQRAAFARLVATQGAKGFYANSSKATQSAHSKKLTAENASKMVYLFNTNEKE